jgi:hypothetical protein
MFNVGDYVRLIIAPQTRMGTIASAPNAKGMYLFHHDLRFTDRLEDSFVYEDEIELCEPPTNEEVKAINALIKRSS